VAGADGARAAVDCVGYELDDARLFWVGQQTQLNLLARSHHSLAWIHTVFLFAVTLIPFSTRLLGQFSSYRLALAIYGLNIVMMEWLSVSVGIAQSGLGRGSRSDQAARLRRGFGGTSGGRECSISSHGS
jgi:hypothetical protein